MATIINADTSDGLKLTSDTSGQIDFQSAGSTKATIDTSGNLKFNSGYGSVVTAFGVRAWVNFNGTGTVAIRASGNVSSITDRGVGNYTVNFATNMPDADYAVHGSGKLADATNYARLLTPTGTFTTSSCQFTGSVSTSSPVDLLHCCAIFTR
jgi:hypothetical protein